jgi:hypothetical protein
MFAAGHPYALEWLSDSDNPRNAECRECSERPVMKLTRDGAPRGSLCEKHGLEYAEKTGVPFPAGEPSKWA